MCLLGPDGCRSPPPPPPPNGQALEVWRQELTALAELKHDVEIRRRLMAYQLYQFRRIAEGNMTSMQKIGQMGTLQNGEALEPDERLSMALEDQMARKIQRQVCAITFVSPIQHTPSHAYNTQVCIKFV